MLYNCTTNKMDQVNMISQQIDIPDCPLRFFVLGTAVLNMKLQKEMHSAVVQKMGQKRIFSTNKSYSYF